MPAQYRPEFDLQRCTIIKPASKLPVIVFVFCVSAFSFLVTSPGIRACSAPQDAASPAALSLHAYEAQLEAVSLDLDQIRSQPAEIPRLRSSLPSEWTVAVNGQEYQVSTDWLDSALVDMQVHPKKIDSFVRELKFHIAAMREAALELEKPATEVSDTVARSDLNEILARREFAAATGPTPFERLEQRVIRWLFGWISRLLQRLHISAKMGNRLAWTFIVIVFLLIVYWAYRAVSTRVQRIEMPSAESSETQDSRAWASDALAAAERGEYREAIRCAYWAAIVRLEDKKILLRDHSRTPRESLRLLHAHAQEQGLLRDLTTRFELAWYGCRIPSAADWSGAKTQLEKIGCLAASTLPTANS